MLRRLRRDEVAHGRSRPAGIDGKHLTDAIRKSSRAFRHDDEREERSGRWSVGKLGFNESTSAQLLLRDVVDAYTIVSVDGPSDCLNAIDVVIRTRVASIICKARVLKREAQLRGRTWSPCDLGAHPSILHSNNAEEATLLSRERRASLRVPVL